jgi:hypothetical protein
MMSEANVIDRDPTRAHPCSRTVRALLCSVAAILMLSWLPITAEVWRSNENRSDHDPPSIHVLPAMPADRAEEVILRAAVVDPSGVGEVTAVVVDDQGGEIRRFPMEHVAKDEYASIVPVSVTVRLHLNYYIEAFDQPGNGPRRAGSPDRPFFARIGNGSGAVRPGDEAPSSLTTWLILAALLGAAATMATWLWTRQGWGRPRASDLPLPVVSVVPKKKNLSSAASECRTPSKATPPAPKFSYAASVAEVRRKLEDDIFWIQLLGPLVDLTPREADHALHNIAGRPHYHPRAGKRFFARQKLLERLQWARRVNRTELQRQWEALNQQERPDPPTPAGSSG